MALARTSVGSYESKTSIGTAAYTTGSFTPPANSLLVVAVAMIGKETTGDLGTPTIEGGGLSFTPRTSALGSTAWSTKLAIFTAPVGAKPEAMTLVVDDDNNQNIFAYSLSLIAYTGYDVTTPIAGIVTSGSTNIGDGEEKQTLAATPTAEDAALYFLNVDADKGPPTPTVAAGWTKIHDLKVGGEGGLTSVRREGSTSTEVKVTDVYGGGGSFFKGSMVSFIVKAAKEAAEFNDSGTGTLTISGSGAESASGTEAADGTVSLSGAGTESNAHSGSGSGTVSLAGSGTESAAGTDTGAGTISLSGFGIEDYRPTYTDSGSGTIGITGSGSEAASAEDAGSGSLNFSGSRIESHEVSATGTGTIELTGAGVESWSSASGHEDAGTGEITLSGSGVESFSYTDASNGPLGLSGSGVEATAAADSATGPIELLGAGAESAQHTGSAEGVIALTGFGQEQWSTDGSRIGTATAGTSRVASAADTARSGSAQAGASPTATARREAP